MIPPLLRDIREEVIEILFNRHVFRTHQEIVRLNRGLQGKPRALFASWSQRMYGVANSTAVRRLAGSTFEPTDVNLVRFLEMVIEEPEGLWPVIESRYPAQAAEAKYAAGTTSDWENLASRRVLDLDLETLVNAVEKVNQLASKGLACTSPAAEADTKLRNLDRAIDTVKKITEKYISIFCLREMRRLPVDKPSGWVLAYDYLDRLKHLDLFDEMKSNRLPKGWDEIFLEPWATEETLSRALGETQPPRSAP